MGVFATRPATVSDAGRCSSFEVRRFQNNEFVLRDDQIAQEIHIDVFVDGNLSRSLMCSPWDVDLLVVGSLFIDGVIDGYEQITRLEVDIDEGIACVELAPFGDFGEPGAKTVSSFVATPEQVLRGISRLESGSHLFHRTGGVHCAALFDGCEFLCWFEDIGRHNAIDKLAGWCLVHAVDTSDKALIFSGRVPYEIISKAVRLGCPLIASPGAPTSLSVEYAREHDIALVGFAKRDRFNVYSSPEHVCEERLRMAG